MRVLVIGATGNVGTGLLRHFAADPSVSEVVAASRRDPGRLPGGARWRRLDLRVPLPPDLLRGVDAVVNLAWLMQPTRAPRTTWAVNVEGTARLLEQVRDSDATV